MKHEGSKSLYRGIGTSFPTCFIPSMVYFTLYENMNHVGKQYMCQNGMKEKVYLLPLLTATIAEMGALGFLLPFDIIRTRLQMNSQDYRYKSIADGLKTI